MSDDGQVAYMPTPAGDLEHQIRSACVPKNEREWWAHHEIERRRAELAEVRREQDRLQEAIQTALGDVCSISLCEINSMSSRQEMGRLARQAAETLRAALEGKP
jgi:hypothetical protein